MIIKGLILSLAIVCLFPYPISSSSIPALNIFQVGEKFTYNVKLWGIPAGVQTVEILERTEHEIYHIHSQTKTTGLVDMFYRVNNIVDSHFDVKRLSTKRLIENIQEGRRRENFITSLDLESSRATIKNIQKSESKTVDVPLPVVDNISLIYYLRTLDLETGKSFSLNVISRRGVRKYSIEVIEKKRVAQSEWKTDYVFVVRDKNERFRIWFTANQIKIPIRIEWKADFGTLVAVLKEIEKVESK